MRSALAVRVGDEIADRWYVDSLIGVGGNAAVYSATHRNGHRVAVKVLHGDLASGDDNLVAAFLREGAVANQVAHPGVVSVFDDGFLPDGSPYLVMELLTGETLDTVMKRGAVGWLEATSIARAVGEVLVAAHDIGLVHRDVKPGNIFVCSSDHPWVYPGRVRLLDFGIALLGGHNHAFAVGTPAYLPPEQARTALAKRPSGPPSQSGVGPATDQWALAATSLALLRGRPLREGDTEAEVLARTLQRMPPVRSFGLVAPPVVLDVFERALSFDPNDRYPSLRAFLESLDDAAHAGADWVPTEFQDDADPASMKASMHPPAVNVLFSAWSTDPRDTDSGALAGGENQDRVHIPALPRAPSEG